MRKLTTEAFVAKAKEVHGDKYDYSNTVYHISRKELNIHCNICNNDFMQLANGHLNGNGCPTCGKEISHNKQVSSINVFINKANTVHLNKYTYTNSQYRNVKTKLAITCPMHGDFYQTPSSHLAGRGCPECADECAGSCRMLSTAEFVEKAIQLHGNAYDYSETDYQHSKKKVAIICKEHGKFLQTPNDHLQNRGCPSCAVTGFDQMRPAILYYLAINNGQAYKIGVTNRSVEQRFSTEDLSKIRVVKTWSYFNGYEAFKAEQACLNTYKTSKYQGMPLLTSGNSELFNHDVLQLDETVD